MGAHHLPAVRDAHDRAARFNDRAEIVTVTYDAAPVCKPIRTRNGSGNDHTSPSSARCAATAATTPASAVRERGVEPVTRGLDHIAAVSLYRPRTTSS